MYQINPDLSIDIHPASLVTLGTSASTAELISDPIRIEALYTLAAASFASKERWRDFCGSALDQLLAENILVPVGDSARSESAVIGAVAGFATVRAHLFDAAVRRRGPVHIIDNAFPDALCTDIASLVLRLPYRRVDRDTDTSRDLHWIHRFSPPEMIVRAVPFLRAIDDRVRAQFGRRSSEVRRAHAYMADPTDIFRPHRDSPEKDDFTVVYYPGQWKDSFGGELLLYRNEEPGLAIAPFRNRLIVFRGNIEHRIAAISQSAGPRLSIVLRYGSR